MSIEILCCFLLSSYTKTKKTKELSYPYLEKGIEVKKNITISELLNN
jgi:hypothetical protein